MNIRGTKGLNIYNTKRQKIFACGDHPLAGGNENSEYSHVSKIIDILRFPISTVPKDLLRRSVNTTPGSDYLPDSISTSIAEWY